MNIVRLYADLQLKPTKTVYKDIALYYKNKNKDNERKAFEKLIEEKYGNGPFIDKEQPKDNI